QVTDVSGRGVGMDVVRTKISAIGGSIEVVSEVGQGSAIIIRLPLTLSIIQALLIKVQEETFAISLGFIDRVININVKDIKRTNNKEIIIYRDNVIPIVRVAERLSLDESDQEEKFLVMVNVGEKTVGLLVDDLYGQQEIVIKSMGKTLQNLKEYVGATVLGDGLVTLILDVAALV
ncbi:MAG: chemotaxis protein CheW, partial [Clostridium sp.]